MEWLVDNWYLVVATIAIIVVSVIAVITYFQLPRSEKIKKVQEWLLYAVEKAEEEFGSATGQIKLRYVYDMFVTKFPAISKVISFDTFSFMVDAALIEFKKILKGNQALQNKVYGRNLTPDEIDKLNEQINKNETK